MLRNVNTVAAVCGPLILIGYLIGASVRTRLASAVGGRRGSISARGDDFSDPDGFDLPDVFEAPTDISGLDGAESAAPPAAGGNPGGIAIEVIGTLIAATFAWQVILLVAPGATASAVAAYSAQVLTVWQSVALWTGLAAIVGHIGPIWQRFRHGGTGMPSAVALMAVYAPVMLLVGLAGFFAAMLVTKKPERAIPYGLATVVTGEWLAWWFDTPWAWGMVNGPELALWMTVTAAVLFARWLSFSDPARA